MAFSRIATCGSRPLCRVVRLQAFTTPAYTCRNTSSSTWINESTNMLLWNSQIRTSLSIHHKHKYKHYFSTADDSNINNSSNNSINISTLRNIVKPFFLKCHPDVQIAVPAKRVNLKAMQNLNGYLDLIEQTIADNRHSKRGLVPVEWPSAPILIEFLIVHEFEGPKYALAKKKPAPVSTRRRVELVVPPANLREACQGRGKGEAFGKEFAVRTLLLKAKHELSKVLTVAGLPTPAYYELGEEEEATQNLNHVWDNEFDYLENSSSSSQNNYQNQNSSTARFRNHVERPPANRYEASRARFTRNLDKGKLQKIYDDAIKDMKADMATHGFIRNHKKRRQNVINEILAKVRVENNSENEIDLTEQLIALRRLSLILDDNFDELKLEEMGRLYENMVIILLPQRAYNISSSSRNKRKKRMQETGFQFTYGANEVVTVHVPIDFGDDEIIEELQRNLDDFYKLVGDGMQEFYPSWMQV